MKYFFLAGILFLQGCKEDLPVYSSFCNKELSAPKCLRLAIPDAQEREWLKDRLHIEEKSDCDYRLELIKYRIGSCKNPVVKSVGSDLNGYVRISIKKGFKCYYKVQSDYKNDEDEALERVLVNLKKEKFFKNFFN